MVFYWSWHIVQISHDFQIIVCIRRVKWAAIIFVDLSGYNFIILIFMTGNFTNICPTVSSCVMA